MSVPPQPLTVRIRRLAAQNRSREEIARITGATDYQLYHALRDYHRRIDSQLADVPQLPDDQLYRDDPPDEAACDRAIAAAMAVLGPRKQRAQKPVEIMEHKIPRARKRISA